MATRKSQDEPKHSKLVIPKEEFKSKIETRISAGRVLRNSTISNVADLESLDKEYDKWNSHNSELLKSVFNVPNNEYKIKYDTSYIGYFGFERQTNIEKYQTLLEKIDEKLSLLEQLNDQIELLHVDENLNSKASVQNVNVNSSKVFIVHGHNQLVKVNVARTVEKFGLEAIILHEQPNGGKTIIEKFEAHSDVGFAIVILTKDDFGRSKDEDIEKPRARQNVILELGYFIGKLNRSRVVPLYEEGVELPSDLSGIVYTEIDKGESWKYKLGKELKQAGYHIDLNKI